MEGWREDCEKGERMRWSQVLFKVIIHHIPIRDACKLCNCANVVFIFDC